MPFSTISYRSNRIPFLVSVFVCNFIGSINDENPVKVPPRIILSKFKLVSLITKPFWPYRVSEFSNLKSHLKLSVTVSELPFINSIIGSSVVVTLLYCHTLRDASVSIIAILLPALPGVPPFSLVAFKLLPNDVLPK